MKKYENDPVIIQLYERFRIEKYNFISLEDFIQKIIIILKRLNSEFKAHRFLEENFQPITANLLLEHLLLEYLIKMGFVSPNYEKLTHQGIDLLFYLQK